MYYRGGRTYDALIGEHVCLVLICIGGGVDGSSNLLSAHIYASIASLSCRSWNFFVDSFAIIVEWQIKCK